MIVPSFPYQSTPFIGRQSELAQIGDLLSNPECRLLTLLGPGGIGKTRLAIQEAGEQLPHFVHGVYFVPLAPVGTPNLLTSAVAEALTISFYTSNDPQRQLIHYLREKQMLLVMDNFEHLLAGTPLLTDILQSAPGIKVLTTSRERLNVQEEWVFTVDGLTFPTAQSTVPIEDFSAVQLFVQRARQVQTHFALSDNAEAVKTICQQMEGMPLGLELAASWLRAMPCHQIAAQVANHLNFLSTPLRNIPERHRSLRAVFDQSWSLLSTNEQAVLRKLSVFRGGFDLEAAEHVAGASLSLLAGLADKSLIRLNASGRYDLHELLRQYAADRLLEAGEVNATVEHHFDFFLKLAESAEAHAFGREQIAWFDRIEAEYDNLRAALAWSIESEVGLQFACALGWFFSERGYWSEGLDWLERMLAANRDAPVALRAKALHSAGALAGHLGNKGRARMLCKQALTLARAANDKWNIAWSLSQLAIHTGVDVDQSAALLDESLALFREIDDPMGVSHALIRRSWMVIRPEDYAYKRLLLEEAATRAHEAGDTIILAWAAHNLGSLAWSQDHDLRQAKTYFESSLSLFRKARFPLIFSIMSLADVERALGNMARAQTLYEEALISRGELASMDPDIFFGFVGLAGVARTRGQPERAARLFGAANSNSLVQELRFYPQAFSYESDIAAIRTQLGETAFAEAWTAGRAMTQAQAIAYALENRSTTQESIPSEQAYERELTAPQSAANRSLLMSFSERELQVLNLLAVGLSNREIAEALILAPSTIKWYVSEILSKLGVANRTQAVRRAHELSILASSGSM